MDNAVLLGAGVLGHSLGGRGQLSQLTGQQANGRLDLSGGDGGALNCINSNLAIKCIELIETNRPT